MRVEFKFSKKYSLEIDAAQLFKADAKFTESDINAIISDALQYRNGLLWYTSNFSLGAIINLNLVRMIRIVK